MPNGWHRMNKDDLIESVSKATALSKSDAARAVDAVLENISEALKNQEDVRLKGFGTFSVSKRAASIGRNPRTGEAMRIPAKTVPKFRAGKSLKDAVNS